MHTCASGFCLSDLEPKEGFQQRHGAIHILIKSHKDMGGMTISKESMLLSLEFSTFNKY